MKLANKRILVVGMARSGVAAAQLLLENGATPVLFGPQARGRLRRGAGCAAWYGV